MGKNIAVLFLLFVGLPLFAATLDWSQDRSRGLVERWKTTLADRFEPVLTPVRSMISRVSHGTHLETRSVAVLEPGVFSRNDVVDVTTKQVEIDDATGDLVGTHDIAIPKGEPVAKGWSYNPDTNRFTEKYTADFGIPKDLEELKAARARQEIGREIIKDFEARNAATASGDDILNLSRPRKKTLEQVRLDDELLKDLGLRPLVVTPPRDDKILDTRSRWHKILEQQKLDDEKIRKDFEARLAAGAPGDDILRDLLLVKRWKKIPEQVKSDDELLKDLKARPVVASPGDDRILKDALSIQRWQKILGQQMSMDDEPQKPKLADEILKDLKARNVAAASGKARAQPKD
jgi:hypothetical protein